MGESEKTRDPLDCTMSLGDHLEELRGRLILAILGLAIGSIVSLVFGTRIIRFIERPYDAVKEARDAKTAQEALEAMGVTPESFKGRGYEFKGARRPLRVPKCLAL